MDILLHVLDYDIFKYLRSYIEKNLTIANFCFEHVLLHLNIFKV